MSESNAESAAPDESEPEQPEVFANRAERRAKGKRKAPQDFSAGNGKRPVGRNGVQSPRQYGTRRSG
jgi:hypothetical protein